MSTTDTDAASPEWPVLASGGPNWVGRDYVALLRKGGIDRFVTTQRSQRGPQGDPEQVAKGFAKGSQRVRTSPPLAVAKVKDQDHPSGRKGHQITPGPIAPPSGRDAPRAPCSPDGARSESVSVGAVALALASHAGHRRPLFRDRLGSGRAKPLSARRRLMSPPSPDAPTHAFATLRIGPGGPQWQAVIPPTAARRPTGRHPRRPARRRTGRRPSPSAAAVDSQSAKTAVHVGSTAGDGSTVASGTP